MNIVRYLLVRGNSKTGEGVYSFSIPPIVSCPGSSALCQEVCYARSGRFRTDTVKARLRDNFAASAAPNFVARVVQEVRVRGIHTLRVHVAGDFHSAKYTNKWTSIARRCPRTVFYAYSRSWRVPEVAPALAGLARLPNFVLWFSCDRETGLPAEAPLGVRLAFMQTDPAEAVPAGVSLVFRTRFLRRAPARRVGLALVCPSENGGPLAPSTTCTSCRRCFQ